ncbi:MAG: ABC transporter permease [Hyphomicrobiales bacterium]
MAGVVHYPAQKVLRIALWAFAILIFSIQLAPLVVLIPLSFTSGTLLNFPIPSFSLRWYSEFFGSAQWLGSLRNTFLVGIFASTLATVLGTLGAIGVLRVSPRVQPVLMAALISPMVIPLVVVALAMFLHLARLGLAASFTGLIIAHTVVCMPLVLLPVVSTLQGFDMNLFRAALSLGATPVRAFFRIILPLIIPGVLAGWLFAFATSIDEIVVTLFVGGPEQITLPRQIYSGLRERISPTVAAVATLSTVLAITMLLVVELLRRRGRRGS